MRDLTLLLLARAPLLPRDLSAWGLGGSCANSSPASGSCSLSGAEGAPHQARYIYIYKYIYIYTRVDPCIPCTSFFGCSTSFCIDWRGGKRHKHHGRGGLSAALFARRGRHKHLARRGQSRRTPKVPIKCENLFYGDLCHPKSPLSRVLLNVRSLSSKIYKY